MYCASASLAGNFPASQSTKYCRLSAAASHRRKSCKSSLASFLISSKCFRESKQRAILAHPSSPRFTLDEHEETTDWLGGPMMKFRASGCHCSNDQFRNRGIGLCPSCSVERRKS